MISAPRYRMTVPCKRGHVGFRYENTGACIECTQLVRASWKKANPDKVSASDVRYRSKPNSKQLTSSRSKRWYEANKERVKDRRNAYNLANKIQLGLAKREWHKNNMDRVRIARKKRRACERGAEGSFSILDIKSQLRVQGGCCLACSVSFRDVSYTIDHILPISRGGSNWPDNLQLLCQPCNDSKGAKTMDEWKVAA